MWHFGSKTAAGNFTVVFNLWHSKVRSREPVNLRALRRSGTYIWSIPTIQSSARVRIFILLGLILKIYRSQCMDLRTAVMRAQCFVTVKSASSVL